MQVDTGASISIMGKKEVLKRLDTVGGRLKREKSVPGITSGSTRWGRTTILL